MLEGSSSGGYPPDSRIVETQVARELGTSQAPVREALRDLEALGVVEISPFRGARVRRPREREILEAYGVRAALEALGARLAVPRMTDADLAELRAATSRPCGRPPGAATAAASAEADARFHGRIVELAANARSSGVAVPRAVLAHVHHPRRPRRRPAAGRPTSTPRS